MTNKTADLPSNVLVARLANGVSEAPVDPDIPPAE